MIKKIQGFDNEYFVSDDGFVYENDKRINHRINAELGYCQVSLKKDGCFSTYLVHRLVAEAFIENPENKRTVNHIDGNKQNNAVENLEWCTHSENTLHAYKSGLMQTKAVVAFTTAGEYVQAFKSLKEAKEFCRVSYTAGISNCLLGKAKTAHGYVWKYANQDNDKKGEGMKKRKRRKQILILMIENNLEQNELAELLGVTPQYMGCIIRGTSNGSYKFWETFKTKLNIPDTEIEKYKEVS